MTIDEKFEHFSDYLKYRIDIIANDPERWLNKSSKHQLPKFEYYLKNCVEDKGGKYDFTIRRYSTPAQNLMPISFCSQSHIQMESRPLYRWVEHSFWMGTPFNYKTVIK